MVEGNGKGMAWQVALLLTLCWLLPALPAAAEEKPAAAQPSVENCADLAALLVRQEEHTSRELKQLKRDLAALSQKLEEPGTSEIFGGIGYIFGIFGVAAYVASRRRDGGRGN
jgi:hypothetical protein